MSLRAQVDDLQTQLALARRSREYLKLRSKEARQDLRSATCSRRNEYFKGRRHRYLSIRGGLTMIMKKVLGGVSANRLGLVLGLDIHQTSVCRWEMIFAASLIASIRSWYAARQSDMVSPLQSDPQGDARAVRFAVHSIRGDSTNALVWQRTKLHTCEIRSSYLTKEIRVQEAPRPDACIISETILGAGGDRRFARFPGGPDDKIPPTHGFEKTCPKLLTPENMFVFECLYASHTSSSPLLRAAAWGHCSVIA